MMVLYLIRYTFWPLRPAHTLYRPLSQSLQRRGICRSRGGVSSPSPGAQFHFHYGCIVIPVRWRSSATATDLSGVILAEEGERGGGGEEGERGEGEREGGERWKWHLKEKGRRVDLWKVKQKRFTRHLTNLVRKGKVEEAEQVFQDMVSAKVRPNTVTFNNLIAGLSRHGNADHAFKYFNDLKKRGLLPSNHTYTSLFRACAKMGPSSRQLLEKVVSEKDRRGHLLNTIATNSLIVAMTTCKMIDEAFQVYLDLSKHNQVPDVNTFTVLLSACAGDRERGLERGVHVLQEMAACRVEPDLVFFNTLLQCLREGGVTDDVKQHDETELVVAAVSSQDLCPIFSSTNSSSSAVPNTDGNTARRPLRSAPFRVVLKNQLRFSVFGSKLTLHVTSRGWRLMDTETVKEFLRVLKERNVQPNIQTLNHLSRMAVDWVAMAREVGVATGGVLPDEKCLNAVVQLQAHLGNVRAVEVLRVFGEESGLSLGLAGYRSLAVSCNYRQRGLRLLADMKEAGVVPDQHIMGTLLGNAASQLDYEYLTALMKEMRHCKMRPNEKMALILRNTAESEVPQSPRMKLRFNGFNGYYTLWKRHYPELDTYT